MDIDNRLIIVANAIMITQIRTIGLETLSPFLLFLFSRLDMKKVKDKSQNLKFKNTMNLLIGIILFGTLLSCGQMDSNQIASFKYQKSNENLNKVDSTKEEIKTIIPGAENMDRYLNKLNGLRVGVVGNQTSVIKNTHLVDSLLSLGVKLVKVFTPEHGFRGDIDAGKKVDSKIDQKTGLPLISLYGSNKKPKVQQLADLDMVIFDIQDVGVRFYTYISTLHYVMEACAENNKPLLLLDRPNPNGHYVDGPILDKTYKSFVGMHPVPVVYGMTIGEYAQMINGEGWLGTTKKCSLEIVKISNYTHKRFYHVPIPPSPNLKSDLAIASYPSLCLFEGTTVSVGRGTDRPFEQFGHPKFPKDLYSFKPKSMSGATTPLYENQTCYGFDLNKPRTRMYELNLSYLVQARDLLSDAGIFINRALFFNKLAGNNIIADQLMRGLGEKEIRDEWVEGLEKFKSIRQKYLLYD